MTSTSESPWYRVTPPRLMFVSLGQRHKLYLLVPADSAPGLDEVYRNAAFDGTVFQQRQVDTGAQWAVEPETQLAHLFIRANLIGCKLDVQFPGDDPYFRAASHRIVRAADLGHRYAVFFFPNDEDMDRSVEAGDSGDHALAQSLGWAATGDLDVTPLRLL